MVVECFLAAGTLFCMRVNAMSDSKSYVCFSYLFLSFSVLIGLVSATTTDDVRDCSECQPGHHVFQPSVPVMIYKRLHRSEKLGPSLILHVLRCNARSLLSGRSSSAAAWRHHRAGRLENPPSTFSTFLFDGFTNKVVGNVTMLRRSWVTCSSGGINWMDST